MEYYGKPIGCNLDTQCVRPGGPSFPGWYLEKKSSLETRIRGETRLAIKTDGQG